MFNNILTVTLNPTLDVTLWLDTFIMDDPNRVVREHRDAAGKALNVSRVLTSLWVNTKALFFGGEQNAIEFCTLLDEDKVDYTVIKTKGKIRENLTIILPDKKIFKINYKGCPVTREDFDKLKELISLELLLKPNSLVVFSGSVPPEFTKEQYIELISVVKEKGAKFSLDTTFFSMEEQLKLKPFIIKPNNIELSELVGRDFKSVEDMAKCLHTYRDDIDNMLISLGAEGVMLVSGDMAYKVSVPKVEVNSTVGAGDTTLSGFLLGLIEGLSLRDCAIYAAAAGTASVTLDGTGVINKEMLKKYALEVMVEEIKL